MSDMKTFTVRELDRETARVMEACDTYGAVRIKRRDGRSYMLQRENDSGGTSNVSFADWVAERRCKTREIFGKLPPMTKKQVREFDRMIAGE